MLAGRIAERVRALGGEHGQTIETSILELRGLATDIANAIVTGFPSPGLADAIDLVAKADGIIASTPVYKASYSGLFKAFIDVIDDDLLLATPVILSATAGTSRHALVPDDQLRPLFAFLRALPVPTSVFAATEDWGTRSLTDRIDRASWELYSLMRNDTAGSILGRTWGQYQHVFGGAASDRDGFAGSINFDTEAMRLATGG
jgi:FMN reductase